MISFLTFLKNKILTESTNSNLYNARIIELYPCAFYYLNNKKPFEYEDLTLNKIRSFIQKKYKANKQYFTKEHIFKYTFIKGSPLKYMLNCIDPKQNPGSEELILSKVKQAIMVYNKIFENYSPKNIKNIYWTADGKPEGVDRKNTGDIFIELNTKDKTYVSISLKANQYKSAAPILFNPSVKSFLERFMDKEKARETLDKISDKIFDTYYKNKLNAAGIKNITPELFRNKNKNAEWMDAFKKYIQKKQKGENINDRINDLYDPAHELLNKEISHVINNLYKNNSDAVKNGLTILLTPTGSDNKITLINELWETTQFGLEEKTNDLNKFLTGIKKSDNIKFYPFIKRNGEKLRGQGFITVKKDNKLLFRINLVIRESHKDFHRYGNFAKSEKIKNINGAFKIPYLDKVCLSPKI